MDLYVHACTQNNLMNERFFADYDNNSCVCVHGNELDVKQSVEQCHKEQMI